MTQRGVDTWPARAEGPATVKELSAPFALSGPAVSKHLRVLERAGLIARGREAQWRPCRLEAAPLKEVADWTGRYRSYWEQSFDRLDAYLRSSRRSDGSPSIERAREMAVTPGHGGSRVGSNKPELVITRVFDAPRNLVFQAWVDPTHLRQWCAPHGYELSHCEGEARPGAAWRCCMRRSSDGKELWLGGVYRKVVENELIEQTHVWDEDGDETIVTVRFEDEGRKTRMTMRQTRFASVAQRDGHRGGWMECFERLEALLATLTSGPSR